MIIKALPIKQPFAYFTCNKSPETMLPYKRYEVRDYPTKYRGRILIYSKTRASIWFEIWTKNIAEELNLQIDYQKLEFGKAIAVGDLTDCIEITEDFLNQQSEEEILLGQDNWKIRNFALRLENVVSIIPFPLKEQRGLFDVDDSMFHFEI